MSMQYISYHNFLKQLNKEMKGRPKVVKGKAGDAENSSSKEE